MSRGSERDPITKLTVLENGAKRENSKTHACSVLSDCRTQIDRVCEELPRTVLTASAGRRMAKVAREGRAWVLGDVLVMSGRASSKDWGSEVRGQRSRAD